MDDWMPIYLALSALALVVTKVIDFIRGIADKDGKIPTWCWNVLSLVIGVAYCVLWQVDLSASLFKLIPALATTTLAGTFGYILTGLTIGAMSGFFHDVISTIQAKKNLRISQSQG